MKTLGLLGGTSWTSTVEYYRLINETVATRLGGLHSAKLVLASIDFADLELAMRLDDRPQAESILIGAAGQLARAGADGIMLCSNLIHRYYEAVAASVDVPCLHIGDAIAAELRRCGYATAALLGTRPLMEEAFFSDRIRQQADVTILTPEAPDRQELHTAIFERMCRNIYTDQDRARLTAMIQAMQAEGAQCALLCCTELPILLPQGPLPLVSSTLVHSRYGVDWALGA
jgi:aspartate racemase